MKVLITGALGFVGSHLIEYCLEQGDEVWGTLKNQNDSLQNLTRKVKEDANFNLLECELTDYRNVLDVIKTVKPSVIFHLAAQSFVPTSWNSPADTVVNNSVSQINIFEALRETKQKPVIHIACSSEEYGMVHKNELPITEDNKLRPMSPYAVSKVTQEMLAIQYHRSYGLKTVITRAFNHTGPRRGLQFVCPAFAKQIIDAGSGGEIKVGNLESYRDFTDVRDMVRAYYLAATNKKIKYGEPYNICSEETIQIKEILNKLWKISGYKNMVIKKDKSRMRPSDVPILHGDCSKFKKVTNWEPKISMKTTLKDIYNYLDRV